MYVHCISGVQVSAQVEVAVADLNDNAPVFPQTTYSTSHLENNSNTLVVATLTAQDPDDGPNGDIRYSITGGNSGGVFTIDRVSVGCSLTSLRLCVQTLTRLRLCVQTLTSLRLCVQTLTSLRLCLQTLTSFRLCFLKS